MVTVSVIFDLWLFFSRVNIQFANKTLVDLTQDLLNKHNFGVTTVCFSGYGSSIDSEASINHLSESCERNIVSVRAHLVLLLCCIHSEGPPELRGTVVPSVIFLIPVCPSLGEGRSRSARSSDRLLPGRRNRTVLPDRRPHLNFPPPGAVPTPFLVDFCIRVPSRMCQ